VEFGNSHKPEKFLGNGFDSQSTGNPNRRKRVCGDSALGEEQFSLIRPAKILTARVCFEQRRISRGAGDWRWKEKPTHATVVKVFKMDMQPRLVRLMRSFTSLSWHEAGA